MKKEEFTECDTCRAKSGSPVLCKGCLHNRRVIEEEKKHKTKIKEMVEFEVTYESNAKNIAFALSMSGYYITIHKDIHYKVSIYKEI